MCPSLLESYFLIPSAYTSSPILNGGVLKPEVGVIKAHVNAVPTVDSIVSIANPFVFNIDLITTPLSGSPTGFSKMFTPVIDLSNSTSKNPVSSLLPVTLSTITKLGALK